MSFMAIRTCFRRHMLKRVLVFSKSLLFASSLLMLSGAVWADDPQGKALYGRVHGGLPVAGESQFPGETIDLRKGVLGWETLDVHVPGNGGLDIEIYRQFMTNERIERGMEDWNISLPRVTMGTNPGGATKFDLPKSNHENNPGICADDNFNANAHFFNAGFALALLTLFKEEYEGTAAWLVYNLFLAGLQFVSITSMNVDQFYTGIQLTVPGQGTKLLLRNANERIGVANNYRFTDGRAINARYVTSDNWLVECLDDHKGRKNNFIAYSPEGRKYTFDVLSKAIGDPMFGQQLGQYVWYPSKVEDQFGNTLTYSYVKDTYLCLGWDNYLALKAGTVSDLIAPVCPATYKLKKIKASDGREVVVNYERPSSLVVDASQRTINDHGSLRVSSIVAGNRQWRYEYGKSFSTASNYLRKVELPGGLTWEFTKYPGSKGGIPFMANDYARNFGWPRIIGTTKFERDGVRLLKEDGTLGGNSFITRILGLMESVKTPLGARITYDYQTFDAAYFQDTTSKLNKVFSVASRTVSGPGIETATTSYQYGYNASLRQGITTITMPATSDGAIPKTVHTFDLTPGSDHFGLPVRTELFANDTLVKTTDIEYATLGSIGEPTNIKESPRAHAVMRATSKVTVINEDGNVYVTEFSEFDRYGGPGLVTERGNPYRRYINNDAGQLVSPAKSTRISYFSNTEKWIVGLAEDQTLLSNGGGSGNVIFDTSFNPEGTVKATTKNNVTINYGYTPKGDLSSVKWRSSGINHTKTYEKHKYGVPQTEKHPAGITITRELNNFGETTKLKNARSVQVSYDRDPMGRIKAINHPDFVGSATEWNLEGNPRRRKETTGNVEKIVETDALGNEVSIASTDLITGITTYQVKAYDSYSNLVFESNKSYSPNPLAGVRYQYDVLNRKVYVEDQNRNIVRSCYSTRCVPSGAPFSGWDLSGYLVNVETIELPGGGDESGSLTQNVVNINASIAYGDPGNAQVTGIFIKERETNDSRRYSATLFERTLSGQPIKIAQGGRLASERIVRSYEYYPGTTQIRYEDSPDIGRTEFQYDEAGNIRRKVVNGSLAVAFTYDHENRVLYEDYPNDKGTPDVSYAYDANGNLRWIDNGYSRISYEFNTADLTEEVLYSIGGLNYHIDFEWNYDRTLQAMVYPDGERVDFAPNGYGAPTSVGRYARYATYHPSGYIESFEYGNGINYRIGVNDYNVPSDFEVRNRFNGVIAQEVYRHNFRKQIYAIDKRLGLAAPVFRESYRYTPSNYLSSGTNQLGAVSYDYDQFGNIRTKQENGETLTMTYRGLASGSLGTRLNTVSSTRGTSHTYAYDSLGNVTNNGRHTFSFDNASRMGGVNNLGISYFYDGRGHRIVERSGTETKITLRSEKGYVLYQQNVTQNMAYKYYRLGSMLVAESEDPCTVNCRQSPTLAPRTVEADHGVDQADIYAIQKSAALNAGVLAYSLELGNKGPQAARNVQFRQTIPAGNYASYTISKGTCTVTGLEMTCKIGSLGIGEVITFEGTLTGLTMDQYNKEVVSRIISSTSAETG